MEKTAIFVEGQTELIFVREFLLKIFDYQNISLECFNLHSGNEHATEYPYSTPNPTHFFTILNVGSDDTVLSYILEQEAYFINKGFTKMIGLRDMFSKDYIAINGRIIDESINQEFINVAQNIVNNRAQKPENIKFCYAIMETEAWFLGMQNWLTQIDSRLTNDFIKAELGFDLDNTDPETTFFHPATVLGRIYALADKKYGKSVSDTNTIVNYFTKNDFTNLYKSPKCGSFCGFYDSLGFL
jgi:hypothetical protein